MAIRLHKLLLPVWVVALGTLILGAAWLTAIINNILAGDWIWTLIAFFIPPLGIIQGIIMWVS